MKISLYTDGACSNNQSKENIGGWAYLLIYGAHKKHMSGRTLNTTNNAMEIKAIVEGLKAIKDPSIDVVVFSDSQYVVSTVNLGWKKNANQALWEELFAQISRFKNITFTKVKGHASNDFNNFVDKLAVEETKKVLKD